MANKQVAVKSKNEIATGDISADLIIKSAGRGLENITNDDITIPRLAIVQAGSPQRKKKDEKYIEGAEEGNIFNTVTNQLYSDSITVIPCGYRKSYVEWVPREKGGGLVAVHDMKPEGTKTDPKTRKSMLGENQIVDTAEHFVLVKKDKSFEPAVLTMTSSNLSVSRKWNTLLKMKKMNIKGQMVEPPSFLYMFKLATINAENDLGSWFKYKLEEVGQVSSKEIFGQAEALSDSVSEGKVKASEPVDTDTSSSEETNTKTPF
jgi:hypothetical protein|tara:strand:+ start:185 stop:970 length:786 start_codon:yes stop_codon:yes gene_type:complete